LTVVKVVWLEAGQAAMLGKGVDVLLVDEDVETEEVLDVDEEVLEEDELVLEEDELVLEEDELLDAVDDVGVDVVVLVEDVEEELDVEDTLLVVDVDDDVEDELDELDELDEPDELDELDDEVIVPRLLDDVLAEDLELVEVVTLNELDVVDADAEF
jgi:hypothetical protein